jgi:hypothetical protein
MFVAVAAITEQGQPLFLANPVKTTVKVKEAFRWEDEEDARRTIAEAQKIYGVKAIIVPLLPPVPVAKIEKVELQVI